MSALLEPVGTLAESIRTETSSGLRRGFVKAIQRAADLYTLFACEQRIDLEAGLRIVSDLRALLADDWDGAVALAAQPLYDGYPVRHSVQSALLSLSMGIDLGLSEDELTSLALGALVHDVGMLLMPSRLLGSDAISDRDRRELMRHPLHAASALEELPNSPRVARSIASQIHERLDGSGYPRGLQGGDIDRLARIAMVADAFLAMIAPRPHRAAHEPHHAIKEILFATHRGRFDPVAVRHLLRVVSLYPVGSCVWLNDGRIGRVIRSNPDVADRPVVIAIDLEKDQPQFEEIDLSLQTAITITGVGELSTAQEQRDKLET